jgi:hypothetical protein
MENTPRFIELYPNLKKVQGKIFEDEYLYFTIWCMSDKSSDYFIKIKI